MYSCRRRVLWEQRGANHRGQTDQSQEDVWGDDEVFTRSGFTTIWRNNCRHECLRSDLQFRTLSRPSNRYNEVNRNRNRKSAKQKLLVALSKFFEPLGCYVSLISSLTKSLFLRLKFQALIDSSLMKDQTVLSTLTPPHFISAGLQIPTNNFEFIRNQICSRRQFHCVLSEIHFSVLSTCKLVFWNMKGTEDHL